MFPRRTTLSVPGHVAKMHHKACRSQADVIMLDLEDSVPVEAKNEARSQVIRSLLELDWGDRPLTLRINGLDTAHAYQDLVAVVEQAGHRLDTVVVPKVNHPGDIHFIDRLLSGIERNCALPRTVGIEASIETAAGLAQVKVIAEASSRLRTLVFGIADYSASIGARLVSLSGHGENEAALYPGHRWHYALSRMVMAAKANGLMAIDAPYGNFRDQDGLIRSATMACALGCDGKWAIHPDQLDPLNQIFSPSSEEIALAAQVLEAAALADDQGRGAVAVEGRMVDQATIRLARQVQSQAERLGLG